MSTQITILEKRPIAKDVKTLLFKIGWPFILSKIMVLCVNGNISSFLSPIKRIKLKFLLFALICNQLKSLNKYYW